MEFLDVFLGFKKSEDTVAAETTKSDGFYNFQTFEQNVLVRAYGVL